MIKNLNHVCLIVKDLDRAISFYRDCLGLRLSKVVELKGGYPGKVLGIKGLRLSYAKLSVPGSPSQRMGLELHCWHKPHISAKKNFGHICFHVKEIDEEYRRLCRSGVRFISGPLTAPDGHAKVCFGYDPDGNLIEFIEELRYRRRKSLRKVR